MNTLTHIDRNGNPQMVDVGNKAASERHARARGKVQLNPNAFKSLLETGSAKGDIATLARIAGIMAAKKTDQIIPLCHTLTLTAVDVNVHPNHDENTFEILADVRTCARTGVEMEALTAVSAACLTIYDMTKALGHDMIIGDIALERKSGGRSGQYSAARPG